MKLNLYVLLKSHSVLLRLDTMKLYLSFNWAYNLVQYKFRTKILSDCQNKDQRNFIFIYILFNWNLATINTDLTLLLQNVRSS